MNNYFHPLYGYPLAALAFLKATVQSLKLLSLSERPLASTAVAADFMGINVAPADDPKIDDYILARLAELQINQVRMDFSYDGEHGPAERLLERLLAAGHQVMLDMFPPLSEAKALLEDPEAQHRWGEFLQRTFNRYQGRIRGFEIGNAPNRGRWSGFSSQSYILAWSIAVEQSQTMDITLAGPNISDFEPLYNATYLEIMRRFGRSPAIHSDNLFVERVVEPEAMDHRVFGRWATGLAKLNLIKKARVLQAIGQANGCRETLCSYTCWTSKRLKRSSAWPAQKHVDYMVRYLALAASSGALSRIYWGPMICHRDGLIDDQVTDYPAIDQVCYYQRVRGQLADLAITPAFYSLKYAQQRIAGAQLQHTHHQPSGLSIFSFCDRDGKAFHLCWSRDRQAWPLADLFAEQALNSATFTDACGRAMPRPAVINEHPLYLEFADNKLPAATIAKQTPAHIVHLSSPQNQSIGLQETHWNGAYMLRADHQLADLSLAPQLHPDRLPDIAETAVLRDARNRLWNIDDPRGFSDQVTVKLNRVKGIKRFTYRFMPSKGRRHWNNACEMLRRGVATPLPVAFYDRPEQAGIRDSWYLCEFVPDTFSVRQVYGAFREGESHYLGLDKQDWFTVLSQFICHMHNKQIIHRDLSAGNLLLQQQSDGSITPRLIDIGRARIKTGSKLSLRQRLLDLIRICYKLDWADRELFIEQYEAQMGRSFSPLWRVPFSYYDNKQRFKKWLKKKRKARSGKL